MAQIWTNPQLSGAACNSYTLNVSATNGGAVTKTLARTNNKYFEGETVSLQAQSLPALTSAIGAATYGQYKPIYRYHECQCSLWPILPQYLLTNSM